jgi:hypothetical protein
MGLKETLLHYASHPATAAGVVGSAVLQYVGLFDPLWTLVATTSSLWFPAVSVFSATILPEFGYGDLGTKLLIAFAVLYVTVQLDRLADRTREYLRER